MTHINCRQCGRANSKSAKRCIWCGMPVILSESPIRFDATRVEIGYLSGIERLDGPAPVSLEVNAEGVEVAELLPGSRVVKIAAEDLIEVKALGGHIAQDKPRQHERKFGFSVRALVPFLKRAESRTNKREFLLTINYRFDDETRSAVFQSQDAGGAVQVEKLSRVIAMLIELKRGQ